MDKGVRAGDEPAPAKRAVYNNRSTTTKPNPTYNLSSARPFLFGIRTGVRFRDGYAVIPYGNKRTHVGFAVWKMEKNLGLGPS